MASFKIIDTFYLTNRGFVLVGDITDDGSISIGNVAHLRVNNAIFSWKIIGVEMVDKLNGIAHIGLIVSNADKELIGNVNLKGLEIEIVEN